VTANGALFGDVGVSGPAAPVMVHRRDVYDTIVGVLLVIFLYFFLVGERLQGFPIPIRIEDLVFLLLIPLGYRYLPRQKTKLFWLIAAYFGLNLIPYLAAAASGQYDLSVYPIIMLKELQYFYVAYLICQNRQWWVLGTADALALIIIANGVRAISRGEIDYYGIGTLGNYLAPSVAGAIYLFSTIWVHIRSKLLPYRLLRWLALVVVGLGGLCVFATVSRSSIGALAVYFATYLLLSNVIVLPAFVAGLGMVPALIQAAALSLGATYGYYAMRLIGRAKDIGVSSGYRVGKWMYYLDGFQPVDYIFGRGKGYPNAMDKTFGLGVDSQYVRTFVEEGAVGVALTTLILWYMLIQIKKRGGEYQHAWGVVMAMLVLCVPLEAMQISKSGGFFWLLMFYLLMCQRRVQPQPVAQ
jgi:hypothetical protein